MNWTVRVDISYRFHGQGPDRVRAANRRTESWGEVSVVNGMGLDTAVAKAFREVIGLPRTDGTNQRG